MNKTKIILALAAAAPWIPLMVAQELPREVPPATVTVQPIQVGGTVAEFGDGTIAIRTEPSVAPVQYRIANTTQWVDEAGNVVTRETVRAGVPVMLYYTKAENGAVVSKVIVKAVSTPPAAPVRETVTTTTVTPTEVTMEVTGTISHFGDGFVAMRNEATAEPVQYIYSDVTKWMDEAGRNVARENVRAGSSATIYHTKSAHGLIARKVVVRRPPVPVTVETTETEVVKTPAVIEEKVIPKVKSVVTEKKPVKKVVKKPAPKPIKKPAVKVVETPAPVVTKKTTTTTTTILEKKKDDD